MSAHFHNIHNQIVFPELDFRNAFFFLYIAIKNATLKKHDLLSNYTFIQFSHSVVSNSLWPHGLQHARLPCTSPTPGPCSNSYPLSQWCHPTISSSYIYVIHIYNYPIIELIYVLSLQFLSDIHSVICWGMPLQSIGPEVRRPHFCPGSIFAKWPWLSHSFWSLSPCRSRKGGPSTYELHTHANIGHYFHNFMSALQDTKRYIYIDINQ